MKSYKLLTWLVLGAIVTPSAGQTREAGLSEPSAAGGETPRVLTLLDYFESGRREVDAFVLDETRDAPPGLAATIERSKRSCVRVEFRSFETEDRYQVSTASGVLIQGGRRVMTAGHAVHGTAGSSAVVTLLDGQSHRARVLDKSYEIYGGPDRDWAILELDGPPVAAFPSAEIAAGEPDGLAFILGYPDQIGIDADGRVAFGAGNETHFLEPLATLGVVDRGAPLRLIPSVGSIPTSGMSGAPVFDAEGRLIGIFVSVGKAASASAVVHTYNAASVAALKGLAAGSGSER